MEDYYTTEEVATKLHITPKTVRNAINRNELVAIKIGKVFRISEEELNNWLNRMKTGQETR